MKKRPNTRAECYRLLGRLIGHDGIPNFLRTPQPALEDRTGAQCPATIINSHRRQLKLPIEFS